MKYVIDRIEGVVAVCEAEDRTMHNIPLPKLPMGVKEGDKISETGKGFVLVDNSADRERIKSKMNGLFKRESEE